MNALKLTPPPAESPRPTTLVAAVGEADVGRLVTITALRIARGGS
ncbi:MAG TPA: hypothetical protein VFS00_35355 [Polyangiaceae bacterium]|nr:hypothetical protein [Polyangiaceae bacterium]